MIYASAANPTVTASPLTIPNDGTTPSYITVRCLDDRGEPMQGLAAANVVIAVSGSSNTVTQPTGFTDANGDITGSFVSSLGEAKTASATILGTAVTDTASITVSNDLLAFGAGPNAPTWASETDYVAQTFDSPIPSSEGTQDAAGWYWLNGDRASVANYDPVLVTYPVVATPIGTRTVMKSRWPGQRNLLSALDAVTDSWPCKNADQSVYVRVSGAFVGTVTFEHSDDNGASWTPQSLTVRVGGGATGSSTSVIGTWGAFPGATGRLVRCRMSSYTSGSATVDIGRGGSATSARARAGTFSANQTKLYHRELLYISPTFDNNGNVGVKMAFFRSPGSQNHYWNLTEDGRERVYVGLQNTAVGPTTSVTGADDTMPRGEWLDMEYVIIANTGDNSDGVLQVWVNNVQVIDRDDIQYFADPQEHTWSYVQVDTTFGGGWNPSFSTDDTWFYTAGFFNRTAP